MFYPMSSTQTTPQADTATLVEQLDVLADRLVVAARGAGDHAGLRDAGSLLHAIDRLIAAVVTALMSDHPCRGDHG